jgi:hypothetical protein
MTRELLNGETGQGPRFPRLLDGLADQQGARHSKSGMGDGTLGSHQMVAMERVGCGISDIHIIWPPELEDNQMRHAPDELPPAGRISRYRRSTTGWKNR